MSAGPDTAVDAKEIDVAKLCMLPQSSLRKQQQQQQQGEQWQEYSVQTTRQ
jgi:hypothetical protein